MSVRYPRYQEPPKAKFKSNWLAPLPLFVSRPTADGLIVSYSIPTWLNFLICSLATINLVVWGFLGLVLAFRVAF